MGSRLQQSPHSDAHRLISPEAKMILTHHKIVVHPPTGKRQPNVGPSWHH
jgi:hypothetical protein